LIDSTTNISTGIKSKGQAIDPQGPEEFASFFFKEDIESLVEFENQEGIRVFPRYVYRLDFYSRLNAFCWEYFLHEERIENSIKTEKEAENEIKNTENEHQLPPPSLLNLFKKLDTDEQEPISSFHAESDFLSLLLADPDPFYGDRPIPAHMKQATAFYADFWKYINPFQGYDAPTEFSDIEPFQFETTEKHLHLASIIKENQRKSCVLDFLTANYIDFIKDCVAVAQKSDFCYGHIWEVKSKYLQALYDVIKKDAPEGVTLNVYPEGSTLTLNLNQGNSANKEMKSQQSGRTSDKESAAGKNRATRHSTRIKEYVRQIARELWIKDSTITIADMAVHNEISKIAVNKEGEMYSEVTIKNWIKDLAPNRRPGRRPKNKKN